MFCRVIVVLVFFKCAFGNIGDPCTVAHTRENGICKLMNNCPPVKRAFMTRKKYTKCGHLSRREIVCCPPDEISTTPTTTTTSPPERIDRISVQKCREYAEFVYEKRKFYEGVHLVERTIDLCGHQVVPLVVGGEDAGLKEFPHMALLGYQHYEDYRWLCGGSLISDQYVMTAAHCLRERTYGPVVQVRLGELNISTSTDTSYMVQFNVTRVIIHPNFNRYNYTNDIGLIQLQGKVVMNDFIRAACLPTTPNVDRRAIATGWGAKDFLGSLSETLQKVTLDLFSKSQCLRSHPMSPNLQLCAGSRTGRKDTCQSDSGGPLQVYHKITHCMYSVIGVTSMGSGCGTANVPGIYSKVFAYLDWIEREVWS